MCLLTLTSAPPVHPLLLEKVSSYTYSLNTPTFLKDGCTDLQAEDPFGDVRRDIRYKKTSKNTQEKSGRY